MKGLNACRGHLKTQTYMEQLTRSKGDACRDGKSALYSKRERAVKINTGRLVTVREVTEKDSPPIHIEFMKERLPGKKDST
jgi:hypothetical protein